MNSFPPNSMASLNSMSNLVPVDQFGSPLIAPPRRPKKPPVVPRYTIAEALKLKAKVTGQNEFVAFKRKGEKGRISAPGAETETWAKLTPERKNAFNQLANTKNEAQRRVGKKELKEIIKNAIYQYIPDDDMRVDFASKLIGEIKEKCEQLARVADLDVAFYTVGDKIDQLAQDQAAYGANMVHQDVKGLLQDSIKRVTGLCTNHRQQAQHQLLEFKEALQRASGMQRSGASSGDPQSRQQNQMLSLLSTLMGVINPNSPGSTSSSMGVPNLIPPSSSSSSSSAAGNLTAAAAALAAMQQFNSPGTSSNPMGLLSSRPGTGSSSLGGYGGMVNSNSCSGLSGLSAITTAMNSNNSSNSSGSSCSSFSGLGTTNALNNSLSSCGSSSSINNNPNSGINGLAAITNVLNGGNSTTLGGLSGGGLNLGANLGGLGSLGGLSGSLGSSSGQSNSQACSGSGMGGSMSSGLSNTSRNNSGNANVSTSTSLGRNEGNRLDGSEAWSAESLAQLKRSRPADPLHKVSPSLPVINAAAAAAAAAAVAAATAQAKRARR